MKNILTYCNWGDNFDEIVVEINGEGFSLNNLNKHSFARNQVFIYIDVSVNNEYLTLMYGEQIFNGVLSFNRTISELKIIHPNANLFKNVFNGTSILLKEIEIVKYSEVGINDLSSEYYEQSYSTTHIFVRTDAISKELIISPKKVVFRFFDELGFFIVQQKSLKHYIEQYQLSNNIIAELENGDNADNLPLLGIMSIFWGFRPWYYKVIITEELDHDLPVGKKVYNTGTFRLNEMRSTYHIVRGDVFKDLAQLSGNLNDKFENGQFSGYSMTFYVAGGRSSYQEFEALQVYIHIQLLKQIDEVVEYDQIDPLDEFNNLFEEGEIGDGVSLKV